MQTLIPFTAHWFMTRAMLITCKACNCACRKHESAWIVYNYSITLFSEGEMILWQANVTGIKDQRNACIELWDGLKAQLKQGVQDGDTKNAITPHAPHHISALFMTPMHALAALEGGHIRPSVQRSGQYQRFVLFSATALASSRADIFRHALDSLCVAASGSYSARFHELQLVARPP